MQNSSLKIAHVLGGMDYGGVESMALRLIRGLSAFHVSQVVVSIAAIDGARAWEFANLGEVKRHPYTGYRLRFIVSCARLLRAVRPDRVLAYNFGNHAMVSIAAWLAGVPLTYVRVAGSPLRDRRTRWKSTILAHLARPFCRGEIAVSESVQNQLIEGLGLPGSRVHLIPNGCDIDAIEQRAAAARATRQSAGPRRIIMVSRMDDAKDHPVLLSAMKLLWAEGCDSQLTLVGNGPMRQEHESIALGLGLSGAVRFLENRTDVPELIGSSDVLTHPTHTEGFPNVLIEAMAARVPIVATDIPPCREILGNGTCGVLVPPRDPEALALAIRRVLEDASLRQQITGAAAQRVRALYDIRVAVERYAQLLAVP